jgi:hypothetical protein
MSWTATGDDYPDKMAALGISDPAYRCHHEALTWCNRVKSDGAMPRHMLRRAVTVSDPEAVAAELVSVGLWTETESGWEVDWTDQQTREQRDEKKAKNAQAQADYRERKELHDAGNHDRCDPRYCPALKAALREGLRKTSRNDLRNESRNDLRNVTPTPPLPTPPHPLRGGEGDRDDDTRSAGAARDRRQGGDDKRHVFEADSSGLTCKRCGFPSSNARHVERGEVA